MQAPLTIVVEIALAALRSSAFLSMVAASTVLALIPGASHAEDAPPPDSGKMAETLALVGLTTAASSVYTKASCKVQLDLDFQKFVAAIPVLKKLNILNPDLTQTKINSIPTTISMAFMIQILPQIVRDTYASHGDVGRCQFAQYLTKVDDYGRDKRLLAASFGFERATYKRINWERFESDKLPKVATNFKFGPEFSREIAAEQ